MSEATETTGGGPPAPAPAEGADALKAEGALLLDKIRRAEGTPGDAARLHEIQLELGRLAQAPEK